MLDLTTWLVCAFILGTILGALFKVYILVLAIGIGLCLVVAAGIALESSWRSVLIAAVVNATAIQLGYSAGAVIVGCIRQKLCARGNGCTDERQD